MNWCKTFNIQDSCKYFPKTNVLIFIDINEQSEF